uniref:DUF2384 domain-containing protein n=1 Tax=Steinernema glaseri TaxID=37863 RepID=A0A1I7YWW2_9BILA
MKPPRQMASLRLQGLAEHIMHAESRCRTHGESAELSGSGSPVNRVQSELPDLWLAVHTRPEGVFA